MDTASNNPIPAALAPKRVAERLAAHDMLPLLDSLAFRGIQLNTWQALELMGTGHGSRCLGKTYLGFVKIAEDHRARGFDLSVGMDLTHYDPDLNTRDRKIQFLAGLVAFIDKHYADVYDITATGSRVKASLVKAQPRSKWWRA